MKEKEKIMFMLFTIASKDELQMMYRWQDGIVLFIDGDYWCLRSSHARHCFETDYPLSTLRYFNRPEWQHIVSKLEALLEDLAPPLPEGVKVRCQQDKFYRHTHNQTVNRRYDHWNKGG